MCVSQQRASAGCPVSWSSCRAPTPLLWTCCRETSNAAPCRRRTQTLPRTLLINQKSFIFNYILKCNVCLFESSIRKLSSSLRVVYILLCYLSHYFMAHYTPHMRHSFGSSWKLIQRNKTFELKLNVLGSGFVVVRLIKAHLSCWMELSIICVHTPFSLFFIYLIIFCQHHICWMKSSTCFLPIVMHWFQK